MTISTPRLRLAPRKAMRPKPSPPAAPPPACPELAHVAPGAFATTSAYCSAPRPAAAPSQAWPLSAARTADAPLGPVSGLSTSHATTNSHSRSSIGIPERSTEASPASAALRGEAPSLGVNQLRPQRLRHSGPTVVGGAADPMMNLRQPLARRPLSTRLCRGWW